MATVKIAELKNNLSRHLAQVRAGAELTVLDRDVPIARLVPFAPRARQAAAHGTDRSESTLRLAELQRLGIVGAGDPDALAAAVRAHAPVRLPKGQGRALDALLRLRRESRR